MTQVPLPQGRLPTPGVSPVALSFSCCSASLLLSFSILSAGTLLPGPAIG